MAFAFQIALLEQPAISALWIGKDFPAIVIHIPEEKAVGAVLQDWLADLVQIPPILLLHNRFIRGVHFFLSFDIQTVILR